MRVLTQPEGGTVIYQGREVRHGEAITVQKGFDAPQFDVGDEDRPVMVDMTHSMDPWLIGDGALLFVFIVPGLVGGGVDFGTGAWRRLDDPQVVHLLDR